MLLNVTIAIVIVMILVVVVLLVQQILTVTQKPAVTLVAVAHQKHVPILMVLQVELSIVQANQTISMQVQKGLHAAINRMAARRQNVVQFR